MRLLSLAVLAFALAAFFFGLRNPDAMTFLIAGAAALSALAAFASNRLSDFLKISEGLFAVETIAFGLAYLAHGAGFWPEAYEAYALPTYLPLATALFGVAIYGISFIPFVRRMMAIADPFFVAPTSIALGLRPFPGFVVSQSAYARACIVFLILVNQFQVALSVRLNFFQRDFGNAIQVADEAHRVAFWHQLLFIFTPLAMIIILSNIVEFYVASNFVLRWRRWMTASYTTRWLLNAMHYKLVIESSGADNPDQRISQDVGGFLNGSGTGSNSGNVGIYNYTIQAVQSATNLVSFSIILWGISSAMTVPFLGLEIPGFLFWVAILYACFATGAVQLIGSRLSKLYFRQQAVEANFRFGLARVREYSEQIALLKGEDREIERASGIFADVFATISRLINVRTWLIAFQQFYGQFSNIIPYVIVAPFYYLKKVDFGQFNQAADGFSNVNNAMNFFVDRYIGLSDFRATVDRLTTFDDAVARTVAMQAKAPRIVAKPSAGEVLAMPDVALDLPDGRKLARVGNLVLVPQESTLVVGPSGAGKSTLFRAISGLWPFGSGEILQPAHAKLMLLPQRPYIPIGPLRDAVAYPSASDAYSDAALRDALGAAGLDALRERLDESDNWQMRLSGGEQQRLAIARALLAAPDWLFLDEATSALDEASEAQVYRAIAQRLPKTTLVSIGHRSTLDAFHKRKVTMQPHEGAPATLAG